MERWGDAENTIQITSKRNYLDTFMTAPECEKPVAFILDIKAMI